MIWENGIEICIISYMKRVASPGSTHDTGCLGLVHWDDPEGGYGEGGGRREEGSGWGTHVYLWRIHFDIWQNQYNIVKLKNKIKIKKKKRNWLVTVFPLSYRWSVHFPQVLDLTLWVAAEHSLKKLYHPQASTGPVTSLSMYFFYKGCQCFGNVKV